MRLLLDTHVLLWWLAGDKRLSRRAKLAISDSDNAVNVSAVSAWEITTKFRIGKLPGAAAIVDDLPSLCAAQAFVPLSITMIHATRAGLLAGEHRDPFDRMLIAQAQSEGMTLVTGDAAMAPFGVPLLW
ncbi:MAG: type II toxin-antitoxin system VapC family toxin [Deltaproteobacteria bacterium]|nr:type II toxin-antitoxin system VapC family toxin [Nannocystaceae bacterium]